MSGTWPIRLAPMGPLSMGASLWKLEGQLMATVVAKITASFALDKPMALIDPEPVRTEDEHDEGHPMRSLRGARELAPQLYQADVLMTGHAYPEQGAPQSRVRLAVEGHGGWLVNKMVTVYGDRDEQGMPQPFERMRLGWEKAYGGIGHADNPLGTGFGSTTTRPPNIVYSDGRETAACFGPIPQSFPGRKKLLAGAMRKRITEGVANIPATFDWAYFQAAPPDQRLEHLRGNEWLLLEGVHVGMRRIRTRLPGVSIVTRVYGHAEGAMPSTIPLRYDMLVIEADELRASLVARGSFPVMEPTKVDRFVVAAGVESPAEPMLWPEECEPDEVLPFEPVILGVSTAPMAAPPSNRAPRPALHGTVSLDPDRSLEPAGSASQVLPFQEGALEGPLEGTVSIIDDVVGPALPFDSGPFDSRPPSSAPAPSHPPAEIPGAPWSREASSVPKVRLPNPSVAGTIDLEKHTTFTGEEHLESASTTQARLAEEQQRREEERAAEARRAEDQARAQKAAEERREREAEAFRKEQEEAEREAKQRAQEQAKKLQDQAKALRDNIYGGFKRKP
ncbi:MAG: DUF2169 domain-containing protein [Myxococcales bacterium]|nr:DUF2169 domain-containing protein [Myxococcales bacterium]